MTRTTMWLLVALLLVSGTPAEANIWSRIRRTLSGGGQSAAGSTAAGSTATGTTATTPVPPAPYSPQGRLATHPDSVAAFNRGLTVMWQRMVPGFMQQVPATLAGLTGQQQGDLTVESVTLTHHNLMPAPALTLTETPSQTTLWLEVPGGGAGWSLQLDGVLAYRVDTRILGIRVRHTQRIPATITVTRLCYRQSISLDTRTPERPLITGVGIPQLTFDLTLSSSNGLLTGVLNAIQPLLRTLLAHQVGVLLRQFVPSIEQSLVGQPGPNPGVGGPSHGSFAGSAPDMYQFALACDSQNWTYHMPYGTLLGVEFSDPVGGVPVDTFDHGDSAIWTGHCLAGVAWRYRQEPDPATHAVLHKLLDGIAGLLDICRPGDGLLARVIVPESSPEGQRMLANMSDRTFRGMVNGVPHVGLEHISRDQYLGVMFGLATTYDYVADPYVQARAAGLISRIVAFLERQSWIAPRVDMVSISAPFQQTPLHLLTFLQIGAHVNPAFQASLDAHAPLTGMMWLPAMLGTLDPLTSYYKWNLTHTSMFSLLRLEQQPERYRDELRAFAITRDTVGHHHNVWFNLVDMMARPVQRSALATETIDDLRRFSARSIRRQRVINSSRPGLETTQYSSVFRFSGAGWNGSTGGGIQSSNYTETIARYPLPVEERPHSDWLWQRNPFQLDDGGPPTKQDPIADYTVPYWLMREMGLISR